MTSSVERVTCEAKYKSEINSVFLTVLKAFTQHKKNFKKIDLAQYNVKPQKSALYFCEQLHNIMQHIFDFLGSLTNQAG